MAKISEKEMERCPKCHSIYIQYDGIRDEFYCLINSCLNRWDDGSRDIDSIQNVYLKSSMWKYEDILRKRLAGLK